MLLQLKDVISLVDDDAIFFDDRSHDKFQIQPTKKLLLKHKDWYVVYMNSEFHNSPAEDEPILCVGIVKNIEDWKNRWNINMIKIAF